MIQSRYRLPSAILRGLRKSQEGDHQVYGNVEYRFPLIRDLGLSLWIFYFERFTGALFYHFGKAWGRDLYTFAYGTRRRFASVPWVTSVGGELRFRLYLLGKLPLVFRLGYARETRPGSPWKFHWALGPVF